MIIWIETKTSETIYFQAELYDTNYNPQEWYNLSYDDKFIEIKDHVSQYIIDDPNFMHFARWGDWKAVIPYEGEMKLFHIYEPFGISEQSDLFSENKYIAGTIIDYLKNNNITCKNVLIVP